MHVRRWWRWVRAESALSHPYTIHACAAMVALGAGRVGPLSPVHHTCMCGDGGAGCGQSRSSLTRTPYMHVRRWWRWVRAESVLSHPYTIHACAAMVALGAGRVGP